LENLNGKDHMVDLGIDGNTGMVLRELGWEGGDWMHLAQDGDQ